MTRVVGVSLNNNNQLYYFDPQNLDLRRNVTVIVETQRGLQFGKVELPPFNIDVSKIVLPLENVIRISSRQDYLNHKKNLLDNNSALKKCKELIEKYNLKMQVIDANFTFDRGQLLFRFIADSRVDFRELVKELANCYKTRIELRQVGVRDKAKEVGGCGPCGRQLCCSRFDTNFTAVSINMAKNQNLSLNPSKINGVCGRLLCCLRYEDDNYKECRKNLPTIGKMVETEKGRGKVISLDPLKEKYNVYVPDVGVVEMSKENGSD
ncbi:MAG: regulatory iron-sulfur-containing complex subunit RicT [Bacilli bacterium]